MNRLHLVSVTTVLLLLLSGCQNPTDSIKEETRNVSISSGEIFEYQTGISGDEEEATIAQQPQNSEISRIARDSTTGWEAVYQYKPETGYQGTDYVEIRLGTGSDGSQSNDDMRLIKIEITVN